MKKTRSCLIGIAAVIVLIGVAYYGFLKYIEAPEIALNQYKVEDLDGVEIAFGKGLSKKPLVINFWATWCEPCIQEFSEFQKAVAAYGDKVSFVMISDEDLNKISTFKTMRAYPFTFVKSTVALDVYGVNSIPVTYFYDADGKLISKISGGTDFLSIEKEINKVLKYDHKKSD